MHRIVFTNRALKDWDGLSEEVRRRIGIKLRAFALDPLVHAQKLSDTRIGSYRFRIGDFRVVADIERDTIIVLRIGHRKDIYR
jgi:mRNA interferase RelE/StbE